MRLQAPAPSQARQVSHLVPTAASWQVPFGQEPAQPGSPVQALLQQMPPTQKPLPHCD
jgi:hypothetical protein